MTLEDFQSSLQNETPPEGLPDLLSAMWYAGKDNWEKAHDIAQDIPNKDGYWIHAYLHRWEGDDWNANYWYQRAGQVMPAGDLKTEWQKITERLLEKI